MFYVGTDNGLWTRSRDPDSGNWTSEAPLGGSLTSQPIAAMIPGTDTLQVFYAGGDNALWTRWSDPGGYWSDEQSLGGTLASQPVAAVIPGTDILHVFYRGADHALWTRWRDPAGTGTWSDEQSLGGVLNGNPVTAQIPGTDILQVFYRGEDNALWTVWRSPGPTPSWSPPNRLGGFLTGDPAAAQIPGTDILQVFYRGGDNALWTRWRDPAGTGTWEDEQSLGGGLNGDPLAIAIPGTDILQVFYRGGDNALWTRWRNPGATPSPPWSDEQSLGGVLNGDPVAAAPVAAVSPANWMTQLPDTIELSQLTLPGTHESCTAFLIEGASCQNWDLATQLQHGIRYVDIRCRHIQDVFAIHHEGIYVGFNFGEGVRDVCVDFLQANPSECIVMQIKHEYTDADNNLTFQQVLDGYLQGYKSFFYTDDHIPTLNEVRGKIVVVRRFDLDSDDPRGLSPLPWGDDTTSDPQYPVRNPDGTVTFHIQDQYSLTASTDEKWPPVKALLDRAKADASDAWYINFSSAEGDGAFLFPNVVAAAINPQLYDYLGGAPFPARLGTLMLDFPDDNMIRRIIRLNTNK